MKVPVQHLKEKKIITVKHNIRINLGLGWSVETSKINQEFFLIILACRLY